jgi:hypothetical protein
MIPTVRVLSDPFKNARLYYVLEPLLPSEIKFKGPFKKKLEDILQVTREWSEKARITQSLLIYRTYHEHLLGNIEGLKGKQFIFLPATSMDITVSRGEIAPREVCCDVFSDRFRLSNDIIRTIIDLNQKEGWNCFDDFHFMAVSHVLIPFHVTPDFKIRHSLEAVVEQTNTDMEKLGKEARWGATEKSTEYSFRAENSRFGPYLFDSSIAKEIYGKKIGFLVERFRKGLPVEEEDRKLLERLFADRICSITQKDINRQIEDHCCFNSYITAFAYKTIIEKLGIMPVLYARNSHLSSKIFGKLELIGIEQDSWAKGGVMKNADLSKLGESDPRALDFLKQRLYVFFEDKIEYGETKPEHMAAPSIVKTDSEVEIKTKPKLCIFCDRLRCRYVDRCRYEKDAEEKGRRFDRQVKNCVYDFSQNRFTKQDVRKVVEEFGLGLDIDELYEELRFKTVKVKWFDNEKRKFVIRNANEFDLLVEDAANEGYTIADIPLDIAVLNSKFDEDINLLKKGEYLSTSWVKFSNGMEIMPLDVLGLARQNPKIDSAREEAVKYMVRGSEFASKCHIGRLIAKMDKARFNLDYENYFAAVGTARHKLANQRPWIDYMGKKGLHVAQYCEQLIVADYLGNKVKGHGDGFFEMAGNGKKYMFVLDYKRARKGAYEKPAYVLQLLQYAEGIKQMTNMEYDGTVLCFVKRFFHAEPEGESWPEYSLFFVPNGNEDEISLEEITYCKGKFRKQRIQGVSELIESSIDMQKRLLNDEKFFWKYVSYASNSLCCNKKTIPQFRDCFSKEICEFLREKVRRNESVREYFLPGVEL